MRLPRLAWLPVMALSAVSAAVPEPAAIVGEWRGTSKCMNLQLAPACKDEDIIYHFSLNPAGAAAPVHLVAEKVVNGEVLPMGELDLEFVAATGTWQAEFRNPRVHILWAYTLVNGRLAGTCVNLPGRELLRKVDAGRP